MAFTELFAGSTISDLPVYQLNFDVCWLRERMIFVLVLYSGLTCLMTLGDQHINGRSTLFPYTVMLLITTFRSTTDRTYDIL